MKASRFYSSGGPDVLTYEEVDDPVPAAGQALVKVDAIGLNYIDTYHREGLYPVDLPCIPGMEAAGTVAAVGAGVDQVAVGDNLVGIRVIDRAHDSPGQTVIEKLELHVKYGQDITGSDSGT